MIIKKDNYKILKKDIFKIVLLSQILCEESGLQAGKEEGLNSSSSAGSNTPTPTPAPTPTPNPNPPTYDFPEEEEDEEEDGEGKKKKKSHPAIKMALEAGALMIPIGVGVTQSVLVQKANAFFSKKEPLPLFVYDDSSRKKITQQKITEDLKEASDLRSKANGWLVLREKTKKNYMDKASQLENTAMSQLIQEVSQEEAEFYSKKRKSFDNLAKSSKNEEEQKVLASKSADFALLERYYREKAEGEPHDVLPENDYVKKEILNNDQAFAEKISAHPIFKYLSKEQQEYFNTLKSSPQNVNSPFQDQKDKSEESEKKPTEKDPQHQPENHNSESSSAWSPAKPEELKKKPAEKDPQHQPENHNGESSNSGSPAKLEEPKQKPTEKIPQHQPENHNGESSSSGNPAKLEEPKQRPRANSAPSKVDQEKQQPKKENKGKRPERQREEIKPTEREIE
jgi:hypothetical protein